MSKYPRIALKTARDLLEEGRLSSCVVLVDNQNGESNLYVHAEAEENVWILATSRNPYEAKTFRSLDGAVGVAWKIGFTEVTVQIH